MTGREGPIWTDQNGELPKPYLSCHGCKWLRVHDSHYFYCRDLGDKTQPDWTSVYSGGMKRLRSYPTPDKDCRFPAPEKLSVSIDCDLPKVACGGNYL
jgi:hypothetical protein